MFIVTFLELFDGTQTIMSGIITGSGRQKHGALINLMSFYALAIPAAMTLGFHFHLGVEGMYW
jgi:MATE family multidrug resistance protein